MKRSSKEQGSSSLIVRVYWGDILYDTVICDKNEPVTIGRAAGSSFVIDLGKTTGLNQLPLLKCNPDGSAELCFTAKMEGHVRVGGKLQTLEKLRAAPGTEKTADGLFKFRMSSEDTASIVVGYVSFEITWSKEFSLVPRPIVLDTRGAIFTAAVSVSMILLFTLFTVPEVAPPEEEKPPERIVEIIPPKILRPKNNDAPPADAAPPAAGSPVVAQEAPKPPSAAETLKNADLGSLVSNLSSIGANVSAPAVQNRDVAMEGPTTSFSSTAAANANTAKASLGATQGAGEGKLSGTGQLGLAGNSGLVSGTGNTLGGVAGEGGAGLDRQVIDQIVRRRQDRIRLCYERQLNFVPGLAGKVTVQFTIGVEGNVVSSTLMEDTMKNNAVNNCIAQEVKSWTFPRPKGNAMVKVDYPFVFESGGTRF